MIAFWVAAGILAAAAAGLVLQRAARAAAAPPGDDPTLALYRRQLREIDELAGRGLLPQAEQRSAHAEAARRLLTAADAADAPWTPRPASRQVVLAAAAGSALLALGVYVAVGSPGTPDQPYAARLHDWRSADPQTLEAPQMAAVLRAVIAQRPNDVEGLRYLALAEGASGDPAAAARALRRAVQLAPDKVELWEMWGEALIAEAGGEVTPQAQRVLAEALRRDPTSTAARFHLGRAKIEGGEAEEGLAVWRGLLADLPGEDPRRGALAVAIEQVEQGPAQAGEADQAAMIRGMVEGLAARLETQPDDPEGWVRLVRAYAVLGDAQRRNAALARARDLFVGRPEVLQALDAAARTEAMR